jgi:hypothetical protein
MVTGNWPAIRRLGVPGSRVQSAGMVSRQNSTMFICGSPSVITTNRSSSPKPIR